MQKIQNIIKKNNKIQIQIQIEKKKKKRILFHQT